MMHVDYLEAYNFMFAVNKEGRSFLQNKFITIRNGFINEGLITYSWNTSFDGFLQLEKLYFQALSRKIENRALTLSININRENLKYYREVLEWMNDQQEKNHMKLKLKVEIDANKINQEDLNELLCSNKVTRLSI